MGITRQELEKMLFSEVDGVYKSIDEVKSELVQRAMESPDSGIVMGTRPTAPLSVVLGTPIAQYEDGYCTRGSDGRYIIITNEPLTDHSTQVELR